jgi:malonyl-CoA O-methyltransferase
MIFDIPSKKHIAAAFSSKAKGYRSGAFIQHRILCMLVPHIEASGRFDAPWLDAGCGEGGLGAMLREKKVPAKLVRTDLAFGMLRLARGNPAHCLPTVQSDIESLPFKQAVFSGVVASSVLQWLDFVKGLREINRVLTPEGHFVFSMFLNGSFSQLIAVRQKHGLTMPVRFIDRNEFEAALASGGFVDIHIETLLEEYYFPSAFRVLKYMSAIGSTAVSGKRLSRMEIGLLCGDYEDMFSRPKGTPLTVNAVIGIAKKGTSRT